MNLIFSLRPATCCKCDYLLNKNLGLLLPGTVLSMFFNLSFNCLILQIATRLSWQNLELTY